MREPIILWEGACAYVIREGAEYEVRVFSSNHVQHVGVAMMMEADRAETLCRRLNAYPRNTRAAYGLL